MSRVSEKVRLNQIVFGLTVCLATWSKLVENSSTNPTNQQRHQSVISNKWIPITANSSTLEMKAESGRNKTTELDLNQVRECCARLAEAGEKDILEVAASVMAPIERVPVHHQVRHVRRPPVEDDDEQEDGEPANADEPEQESGSGGSSASRRAEDKLKWRPQQQQQQQQKQANEQENRESAIDPIAAEQEAAEASEAEAADRSALDEQLQQQREIIMAQAQSEAKAIREQQEALMRQHNLQQQMQLRMNHHYPSDHKNLAKQTNQRHIKRLSSSSTQPKQVVDRTEINQRQHQHQHHHQQQQQQQVATARYLGEASRVYQRPSAINHKQLASDIQFRDQPDRKNQLAADPFSPSSSSNPNQLQLQQQQQDILLSGAGDVKVASSLVRGVDYDLHLSPPPLGHELISTDDIETLPTATAAASATDGDLHTAAQHHYGSHYGSVKGHHGDYYQFAESHKKGQFHSGFKRGGKKFQISGHASQHKSHAEGHMHWHGKKGKGSQYWDYKHKGKKHHHGHHY